MTDNVAAGDGTGTGAGAKPWFDGLPDEVKGYVTNRGLDKLDPTQAFLNAQKAHMEATKLLGMPAEDIIRVPKPEDSAAWQGVFERLGRPKDVSGYDFAPLKDKVDENFTKLLGETFLKEGISKAAGERIAAALVTDTQARMKATDDASLAARTTSLNELKTDWKQDFEANKRVAALAAEKVGITKEVLDALENTTSYKAVMQAFHRIGVGMGEDSFIRGGGGDSKVLSKEQAKDRIETLKTDRAYGASWMAGDAAKIKEMNDLHRIAYAD